MLKQALNVILQRIKYASIIISTVKFDQKQWLNIDFYYTFSG